MPEICTQSTISVNHRSKAISHPHILEYVLFVRQIHFLDRNVKVKTITSRIQILVFNAFHGERNLKLNDNFIIMSNCTYFLILFVSWIIKD